MLFRYKVNEFVAGFLLPVVQILYFCRAMQKYNDRFKIRYLCKHARYMMKRLKYIFLVLATTFLQAQMTTGQESNPLQRFDRVVIDAGHGGHDPGALGEKSEEKDITLAIALLAGKMIEQQLPDVEVIYTRTDDSFVELHRRADIANKNAADLFISIHCNSNPSPQPYGAETYVMGLHKTQENLEVAKTENAAILMEDDYNQQYDGFNPNSDEDYIMLTMFQSAHIEQSIDFSVIAQEKLHYVGGLRDRGVRQAGFVVLYLTTMPGVLIETGFLSNAAEEEYLMRRSNQKRIAQGIFEAVADYREIVNQDIELSVKPESKDADTLLVEQKPEKIYRIWFDNFRKPKSKDHRKFRGMKHVWFFREGNRYQYTFGKSSTLEGIVDQLKNYRKQDVVKRRYLKNARILEFENDELISDFSER